MTVASTPALVHVRSVRSRADGRLTVGTVGKDWVSRVLLNAPGTREKPFWPAHPGHETFRSRQLHTADYVAATSWSVRTSSWWARAPPRCRF